jgi:hypothetical protein
MAGDLARILSSLSGSPALLFSNDQEPWLCGPASRRVCPSTNAVGPNVRRFASEDKSLAVCRT